MHDNHKPETVEKSITDQELLRLLTEAHVLDQLYAANKEFKAGIASRFETGEKRDVSNAQGLKLGSVSMSTPNKRAVCVDDAVLLAAAVDKDMELIDHLPRPGTPEAVKAIDVLMEHAPELLPDPSISKADAETISAEVLEKWQVTGNIPEGWEVEDASAPRFTVTKGRTKPAKAAIAHLVGQVEDVLSITAPKENDDA